MSNTIQHTTMITTVLIPAAHTKLITCSCTEQFVNALYPYAIKERLCTPHLLTGLEYLQSLYIIIKLPYNKLMHGYIVEHRLMCKQGLFYFIYMVVNTTTYCTTVISMRLSMYEYIVRRKPSLLAI